MFFRATQNRCAVVLSGLRLPISNEKALRLLRRIGFRRLNINLVRLARSRVGVAQYRRGARLCDAPREFDCSSFVKWLYAKRGIWIPRRTVQQIAFGRDIQLGDMTSGDLVYVTGAINWYDTDPEQGVGHVGIATGEGTIIHAAYARVGIVETKQDAFLRRVTLRGIRRHVEHSEDVLTLITPKHFEVESSDDLRWIILSRL